MADRVKILKSDQLVYNAEYAAFPLGQQFTELAQVREYVARILDSKWWRDRSILEDVAVLSKKGTAYAHSSGSKAAIYMPEWGWNEKTIIHELCHQLCNSRHGWSGHGPLFRYWVFEMTLEFHSFLLTTINAREAALRTFLEHGFNPYEGKDRAESQNLCRRAAAPVEEGPVWRKGSVVSLETHIPVSWVHERVEYAGKTVSSFVRAMGGDKGLKEPIAEWWRPVYVAAANGMRAGRWLPRECLNHFDQLTDKPKRRGRW